MNAPRPSEPVKGEDGDDRAVIPALARTLRSQLLSAREHNKQLWALHGNPAVALSDLSKAVDKILRTLWSEAGLPKATLVAVGGYGRGELFPYSDVDLLILMPEGYRESEVSSALERLVSQLWDIGLDASHSVRSISESIAHAKDDLTIATALLEARWLAGPKAPVKQLQRDWFTAINIQEFAQGKQLELQQRYARHQDTPYSLEPNCKESPGGLRDLQVLRWITTAFGVGHRWTDLQSEALITEREARELTKAQRLLQTIRGQLHIAAGRREDRLVFDLQNAVAEQLAIPGSGGRRPSEVLMQRYYRAAKAVYQISSMALAELGPRLFPSAAANETAIARPISEDFQESYGLLDISDEQLFARRPAAILEAFLVLQQHPELKGFTAKTTRALWNHRDLLNADFRRKPEHRRLFLSIFQQPQGIVQGLRTMNNLGILGRALPVFRKIVGQMQHDLFHVYTVDQHILQVIRNLRRFTMDEHAHEFPLCSQLIADFQSPWMLYVAALFHDIAKGRGGDHSVLGKSEVRRFAREHALDAETTRLLVFLVEHHLTMSQFAQKRDLSDPETILDFAKLVRTRYRLTALYLLTVADIRGTSPKVWNNWKARLLEELYHRTIATLTRRSSQGQQTASIPQDAYQLKTQEAERLLRLHGQTTEMAREFWRNLELQYFLRHEPEEIAWHARALAHRFDARTPKVVARLSPDHAGLQVVVYQPDEPDLFARICAYFDRQQMSILDAKIQTTVNGYAMDTFVVDQRQFIDHQREMSTLIEAGLAEALGQKGPLPEPARARLSRQSRFFPIPPAVDLRPDTRGQYHVLNVTAADRTGLLYAIARTLAAHQIRLQTARVMTLGERAEDVFLIEGDTLNDSKQQIALETDLLKAIAV